MTESTMTGHEMSSHPMVLLSYKLRNFVEWFGQRGAYFILPLVLFTMLDVFGRKMTNQTIFGMSIDAQLWLVENVSPMFQSTMLQELEWHVHTALFSLVLGYGFTRNRHVRVDLVRMHLQTKMQAAIEFIGTTFFMIPYTIVVLYFCYVFTYDSFITNEISPSLVGMSHRWVIKTVLGVGLVVALASGVAVWLQSVVVLFGPKDVRFELMTLEWPEDMGDGVEGYKRMVLDDQETDMKKIGEAGKG
ncbi:MAG: TRAP transporter small permease subunit [Rhodospirillaceae bacterium]|jgi:TRAP-type mannitol/chloroaromatic compound transport system permease small subunit|nr:TRAP transporter small permease subunit [Rhodospirillaceae bacterium]MBT4486812.1 TRAP transporter small permease subunit [Rhodospirillaceae bacterium]MBT5193133.1 TRAP transporter small permease subunit [Rhodospirillaceae bacterium]MBT5895252.1 TRAP transporter small permease subunit [Rhodospirillaceae bacterium]MBT6430343.1 TRAP transporter small permease subunit [Rhodospirillaceae bacterium]